jgi:hypothetical protein
MVLMRSLRLVFGYFCIKTKVTATAANERGKPKSVGLNKRYVVRILNDFHHEEKGLRGHSGASQARWTNPHAGLRAHSRAG